MKIAITGHRPDKLGGYDANNPLRVHLRNRFKDAHGKVAAMIRRVIGEQVEIAYDATECVICIQDPSHIPDEDAESSSVRPSLAELDALIETLTQARREADPAFWQADTLIRVNDL